MRSWRKPIENIYVSISRAKTSSRFRPDTVVAQRSRRAVGGDIELDGVGGADDHFRFGSRSAGARRAGRMGDLGGEIFLPTRCSSKWLGFKRISRGAFKSYWKYCAGRRKTFTLRWLWHRRTRSRRHRYSDAAANPPHRAGLLPSYGAGMPHRKRQRGIFFRLAGFTARSRGKEARREPPLCLRFARP